MIHVVLATHDGAETLPYLLRAYEQTRAPRKDWRVVVVDNASRDDSLEVLKSFEGRLPLETLSESRPGKNVALNTALRHICDRHRGRLGDQTFIFTDDDAPPAPTFLTGWEETVLARPGFDLFGGTVLPRFLEQPPRWLTRCKAHYPELFASNQRPEGVIDARHIYGPNMAVSGKIIAEGYRFDEKIGPNGSENYAMGSETEFCVRVEQRAGARAWFTQSASVDHLVRPWQMTREFFTQRAFRHGFGVAQQQLQGLNDNARIRAVVKAHVKVLGQRILATCSAGQPRDDALWQEAWLRGFRDRLRKVPTP